MRMVNMKVWTNQNYFKKYGIPDHPSVHIISVSYREVDCSRLIRHAACVCVCVCVCVFFRVRQRSHNVWLVSRPQIKAKSQSCPWIATVKNRDSCPAENVLAWSVHVSSRLLSDTKNKTEEEEEEEKEEERKKKKRRRKRRNRRRRKCLRSHL